MLGCNRSHHVMPPQVPRPHLVRVVSPAFGAGDLVRVDLRPQARLDITERRHAALGGNACSAEHRHLHITKLAGLGDTEHVAELGDWVRVDPARCQAALRPAQDADHRRDPGRRAAARHPVADGPRTGGEVGPGGQYGCARISGVGSRRACSKPAAASALSSHASIQPIPQWRRRRIRSCRRRAHWG